MCSWKSRERDISLNLTHLGNNEGLENIKTMIHCFISIFIQLVFSFKKDVSSDLNLLCSSCRVLCVTNSDDWPLVATAVPVPPLGGAIMRRGEGEGGVF